MKMPARLWKYFRIKQLKITGIKMVLHVCKLVELRNMLPKWALLKDKNSTVGFHAWKATAFVVALAFEMILPIEAGEPTTQSCCWLACFPGNCTHQIYPWLATQSIQTPSISFFGADGFVRNFMFVCQKTRLGRNGRLRKVRPERGCFAPLPGLFFLVFNHIGTRKSSNFVVIYG